MVVSNSPARPLNIQYGHGQQNGRGMDGTHLDPGRTHRHYQEYVPGGMYVLYEEEPEDNMRRGIPYGVLFQTISGVLVCGRPLPLVVLIFNFLYLKCSIQLIYV